MKTPTEIRIEKMRNGEKIKCPSCQDGYIAAVGNPKTTNVFSCDTCKVSMVLTLAHTWKEGKLVLKNNKE